MGILKNCPFSTFETAYYFGRKGCVMNSFYFKEKCTCHRTFCKYHRLKVWIQNWGILILLILHSTVDVFWFFIKFSYVRVEPTDKRTDVWSQQFPIWKINSGLWAVVWAGMWNKRVWADYEQLLRPVFSLFQGQK